MAAGIAAAHRGGADYRLIVFDFDGTLADTFPWFLGVINDVAKKYRFSEVRADEYDQYRALSAAQIIARLRVPLWKIPAISRCMHRLMAQRIEQFRLFDGVDALFDALRRDGVEIGIVSSNSTANVRRILGARLADRVRYYECGSALFGKAKRLRRIRRRCGLPAGAILYVGDELRDADAARQSGLDFGAAGWGYNSAGALAASRPRYLFGNVAQLRSRLTAGAPTANYDSG